MDQEKPKKQTLELLFKKGEIIKKVKQEDIVEVLKQEILEMVKNS